MKGLKYILLLLIMLVVTVPAIQLKTRYFSMKSLKGQFARPAKPSFSDSAWLEGRFQEQYVRFTEDSSGFRPALVRLYNQVDFSLFRLSHAGKITVGNDDYLFGDQYIESYLGKNFAGKTICEQRIARLKDLQRQLSEKNILLLLIFTPDKATFYPEKIPARYMEASVENPSNYAYYSRRCVEEGINTIDFNRWFRIAKDTSRYPLYPKTGIHWSCYGAAITADSLARYLSAKLGPRVPDMRISGVELDPIARAEDDDIGDVMNLIWEIPYPVYAYPKVTFTADSTLKKPSALFIGDSFYWNWYNPGYIKNLFSNEDFWYYDKDVYPQSFTSPLSTNQVPALETVMKQDVVILIQTNGAYGNPGYGFTDHIFSEMDADMGPVLAYEAKIRNNPDWLKVIQEKAKQRNVTLDEMIRIDAEFLASEDKKRGKNTEQ